MVTRAQLDKLTARVDTLLTSFGGQDVELPPIVLSLDAGDNLTFAQRQAFNAVVARAAARGEPVEWRVRLTFDETA